MEGSNLTGIHGGAEARFFFAMRFRMMSLEIEIVLNGAVIEH